jgi:dGTPase
LENNKRNGGLQLTYAVLGTFSKYPKSSIASQDENDAYVGGKKIGFFNAEQKYFADVARKTGLIPRAKKSTIGVGNNWLCWWKQKKKEIISEGKEEQYWCRHPLAFLVEAADDICYAIIDIEDGYELDYLNFREAEEVLFPIAKYRPPEGEEENIAKLRAVSIGELVKEASKVFLDNESDIMNGTFEKSLISCTKFDKCIECALDVAKKKIYLSERKTKLEIAGEKVIRGLLDIFSEVVVELENNDYDMTKLKGKAQHLSRLMGKNLGPCENNYEALLYVTDFISGMTDRYAIDLYRTLMGIST